MKLIKFYAQLILMSTFLFSCRDKEEFINNNSSLKQDITLLQKDSVVSHSTNPKDPPIKGTNWKTHK